MVGDRDSYCVIKCTDPLTNFTRFYYSIIQFPSNFKRPLCTLGDFQMLSVVVHYFTLAKCDILQINSHCIKAHRSFRMGCQKCFTPQGTRAQNIGSLVITEGKISYCVASVGND